MSNCFIYEGYTRDGYFAPSKGDNQRGAIHTDEFRFTYHPCKIEERARVLDEAKKFHKNEEIDKLLAQFLAPKLVSWSIIDSSGQPVPITTKNILRIEPTTFDRLIQVVIYRNESGDIDPVVTAQLDQVTEYQFESALD